MKLKSVILTVFAVLLTGQITITGQKIYLSPSGNDNDPGTIDRPFASLTRARDKAREYLKEYKGSQPVEVIALEGEYLMMQPLDLSEA